MLSLIPTYKDEPSTHGRCNSTGIAGGWMLHMASSYKAKILHTSARFPMLQHTAFYFPPFAKADGFETTDCLECLQILNILIYGRRVCFKAGDWTLCTILGYGLPERETFRMLPLISFCILTFCKNRTFRFTPVICKDCTILSREWHNHSCGLMICFKAE